MNFEPYNGTQQANMVPDK